VAGTCECGNETLGSVKRGEFLDYLRTGWLLKKDSAPCSKDHYASKNSEPVGSTVLQKTTQWSGVSLSVGHPAVIKIHRSQGIPDSNPHTNLPSAGSQYC
jgi:hypothetical protein